MPAMLREFVAWPLPQLVALWLCVGSYVPLVQAWHRAGQGSIEPVRRGDHSGRWAAAELAPEVASAPRPIQPSLAQIAWPCLSRATSCSTPPMRSG